MMSLISSSVCEGDFCSERKDFEALAGLVEAPVMVEADGFESAEGLKAIYFDGLDYKGKPTKVFAWLGMPEVKAGKAGKVPVPRCLLWCWSTAVAARRSRSGCRGGMGVAMRRSVLRWRGRRIRDLKMESHGRKHEWAGPSRAGIYGDAKEEFKDQWMYHAAADTILAHSLIRSLPGVDADKVGLMGISWGGVITSTVIGIDDRFAFAIPTYGCGDLAEVQNQYGKSLGNHEMYKQVYDPMLRLEKVETPTLWFSWPEDKHFPMDKFANCYGKVSGPYMVSLIPKMGHGHGPPWNKPDSYAFADSITKGGKPWCLQTGLKVQGHKVQASFETEEELSEAVLVYSREKIFTGSRQWLQSAATINKRDMVYHVEAELPDGTTGWFINVRSGKLTVSSDYQE